MFLWQTSMCVQASSCRYPKLIIGPGQIWIRFFYFIFFSIKLMNSLLVSLERKSKSVCAILSILSFFIWFYFHFVWLVFCLCITFAVCDATKWIIEIVFADGCKSLISFESIPEHLWFLSWCLRVKGGCFEMEIDLFGS